MYYIKINKNFVHQVGNQPRLYYDPRSTNHQNIYALLKLRIQIVLRQSPTLNNKTPISEGVKVVQK
jgi:hypothetical protein